MCKPQVRSVVIVAGKMVDRCGYSFSHEAILSAFGDNPDYEIEEMQIGNYLVPVVISKVIPSDCIICTSRQLDIDTTLD